MQAELDAYRERRNLECKRADHNKVLPHGPAIHIAEQPEEYGVLDFKVSTLTLM